MSNSDLATLFSSTAILGIIVTIFTIAFAVSILVYVLNCIGLYRMAKKLNHKYSWLAWIPIAQYWLLFDMPKKGLEVLAFKKTIQNRTNAFWIYIALSFGGGIVTSILGIIPIIGTLLAPLVPIAMTVGMIFILYPAYKDLYEIFLPESSVQGYAIGSIICLFLVPFVTSILLLVASSKDPIEVVDSSYNA